VQLIYNIFEQEPAAELLPAAEEHNIGVIVRVPFDEGALTGKFSNDTTFPEGDFRTNYFAGKLHSNSSLLKAPSVASSLAFAMSHRPR
jgi:aryl-alcohol dehydrogenase-like predicted oxidoreductase